MPIKLAKFSNKKKATILLILWSSDWFSKTPWALDGKPLPYVTAYRESTRLASVLNICFGPLSIMYAGPAP